MALTAEVLFINPDYAKRLTSLNGSVQDDMITAATIIAQDKYLQTYLGTTLFNKLKTDISTSSIAGIYTTILDSYVRKATVWWTMVELLPSLYVRIDNGGLARGLEKMRSTIHNDLLIFLLTGQLTLRNILETPFQICTHRKLCTLKTD